MKLRLLASLGLLLAAAVTASAQGSSIVITTTSIPDATQNLFYGVTLQSSPGTANCGTSSQNVYWSVVSGSPPIGTNLDQCGNLQGYPTILGTYTFTVRAQVAPTFAGSGAFDAKTYTVRVLTSAITILTQSLPNGAVNQDYLAILGAGTNPPGQSVTWTLVAGSLPPGLGLGSGGSIAGNPNTAGTYSFTVQATLTSTAVSTQATFSINISGAAFSISGATVLPNGFQGIDYSYSFSVSPAVTVSWSTAGTVPAGLTLNPTTGQLAGVPSTLGTYTFTIVATGTGTIPGISTKTVTLNVIVSPLTILETTIPVAVLGGAYSTNVTAAGGVPPYTWALSPDGTGLTIDSSGRIFGTPKQAGNINLVVSVTDAAAVTYTRGYSLFVATQLRVLTTSLPRGLLGGTYSQGLEAGGGQAPFIWSVSTGVLPPGLTLSRTGLISGTPTQNGLYPFTVQVVDLGNRSATQPLSIAIGSTPVITTTSLSDAIPGAAYSQTLGVTGGFSPFTWTLISGFLPDGLTLDAASGVISGTATASGTSNFTVQVTDGSNATAQKALSITVGLPLQINTNFLPDGSTNVFYSQTVLASGGKQPYTWSISAGNPGSVTIDPNSGVVSGTPQVAGSYNFTVTVRDAGTQVAQKVYTINIINSLALSANNISGTVGISLSQGVSASGGVPGYSYSLSGSLPNGLSFNTASGVISGTATSTGSSTVTVTVTDSRGNTATTSFTVSISLPPAPPITITSGPDFSPPAKQTAVALGFGNSFPIDVSGTLVLTFASSVGGDDQLVRFSNGSRSVAFTVPAGSTTASFLNASGLSVLTGTTAGTITLTANLNAAGIDVTPTPTPLKRIIVDPAAPVITGVTLQIVSGGFNVTVTGYSTAREVLTGQFHFTPAAGVAIQSGDVTVNLAPAFVAWYQNSASNATGSQFTLTMPFTIQGGATAVSAVSVTLTNSKGSSSTVASQ